MKIHNSQKHQTIFLPGVLGVIVLLSLLTQTPAMAANRDNGADISAQGVTAWHAPALGVTATGSSASPTDTCQIPVDVALVFDHSTSMSGEKLTNAKTGAISFVNYFAGGSSDNDLSPHQMALVGFYRGNATTDVALTTNAVSLRTTIDGYLAEGYTNIGRGIQLGQLQLLGGTDPDYMVLLSDGNANTPQNIATPNSSGSMFSVTNDFYIDVNNNGYIDDGDDISVDFPGDTTNPNFVVINGLLQISRSSNSGTRQTYVTRLLDANGDGTLNDNDDYDFGAGYNFRIINGALYLDANGDGSFAVSANSIAFTAGLSDEIAVVRNGDVWEHDVNFGGDGADVYAQYWATQAKKTGTFIYVIGYGVTGSPEDKALNQSMASPGGYFDATIANIGDIFNQITQQICGIQTTKLLTSGSPTAEGSFVTFSVTVKNNGNVNLTNLNVTDTYDTTYLTFLSANPAPTNANAGTLTWTNLQELSGDGSPGIWEPGRTRVISLTFVASKATLTNTENCAQSTALGPSSENLTSGNSCAPVVIYKATAANLIAFDGDAKKAGVRLKWETGSELDTLAFNVWRSAKRDGKFIKVNVNPIPAKSMGVEGAAYQYTDKNVKPGKVYFYKLEIVGVASSTEWSDVIRVKTLTVP